MFVEEKRSVGRWAPLNSTELWQRVFVPGGKKGNPEERLNRYISLSSAGHVIERSPEFCRSRNSSQP